MAVDLIRYHCPDYRFDWDSGKRRFGYCNYTYKTISLSKALVALNSEECVLDVILHEIAHAYVVLERGHGPLWRAKALALGSDGKACYDSKLVNTPPKPFIGTCPGCHKEVPAYRRKRLACRQCCNGTFDVKYLFTWKRNNS